MGDARSFRLDMAIAKQDALLAVDLVLTLDGAGADIGNQEGIRVVDDRPGITRKKRHRDRHGIGGEGAAALVEGVVAELAELVVGRRRRAGRGKPRRSS